MIVLHARLWTPELRAEREAVVLVKSLFANPLFVKRQVLETIRNDATIREEVRQRALELAERVHLDDIVDAKAWYYATDGGGVFVKTRDGWVERRASGGNSYFAEIEHTDNILVLFDSLRNMIVKLHNDHMECSTNRQDWNRLHQGEWR